MDLSTLNRAQREAVLHLEGPSMVIAGPGAGKTRVLTHRIAHLIASGVPPYSILALTFTNKAAREMQKRLAQLTSQEQKKNQWIGTFHSLLNRLLRIEGSAIGYQSNFTIYDREDSKQLLKRINKELNLDPDIYKPSLLIARISQAKNRMIDAKQYNIDPSYLEEDKKYRKPEIGRIYTYYTTHCQQAQAMDFDDLLLNTYRLLCEHHAIREKYKKKFTHILVDEFQDTNRLQYELLKMLTGADQNLTVIGDDAQSIYAFRGAHIGNIDDFQRDFPTAKIYKLQENYRSTHHILQVANRLIKQNKKQIEKEIFTQQAKGEPVWITRYANSYQEALAIATKIKELAALWQQPYNAFAILYRSNNLARLLEESLQRKGIPYQVVGGISFYQRKEIKDLIAYLRVIVNPHDDNALLRSINYPKRSIGSSTVEKITRYAQKKQTSLFQALTERAAYLSPSTCKKIEPFIALIDSFHPQVERQDAHTLAEAIARQSGLLSLLQNDITVEGATRYENIKEFLSSIPQFTSEVEQKEEALLSTFLEEILLYTDREEQVQLPRVTLSTIHAAKGREFDTVFMPAMEEKIIPSALSSTPEEIDEERRLCYVAITRAERRLFLSYAQTRQRFGDTKPCKPSRFLEEMQGEGVQIEWHSPKGGQTPFDKVHAQQVPKRYPSHTNKKWTKLSSEQKKESEQLQPGHDVIHPQFGRGRVVASEMIQGHQKVKINFERIGIKTILPAYTKLKQVT